MNPLRIAVASSTKIDTTINVAILLGVFITIARALMTVAGV